MSADEIAKMQHVLRTSGRLRHMFEDHAMMARAMGMVVERRGDFHEDTTEALVEALASIAAAAIEKLAGVAK